VRLVGLGEAGALGGDDSGCRTRQLEAVDLPGERVDGLGDVTAEFDRRAVVVVEVGGELVEVDDAAGVVLVPLRGLVLDEVVADREDDVGLVQQDVAGLVAEQAHPAEVVLLEFVGQHAGRLERLDDGEVGDIEQAVQGRGRPVGP